MDYEAICEKLMRACRTMEDEAFIAEAYEALKGFSEDELVGECDITVGESIRAKSIIWMCGEYLKAKGKARRALKEDIMEAAVDFFEY